LISSYLEGFLGLEQLGKVLKFISKFALQKYAKEYLEGYKLGLVG
jgi:hypothetical protein